MGGVALKSQMKSNNNANKVAFLRFFPTIPQLPILLVCSIELFLHDLHDLLHDLHDIHTDFMIARSSMLQTCTNCRSLRFGVQLPISLVCSIELFYMIYMIFYMIYMKIFDC
jgi:hypothetical protein